VYWLALLLSTGQPLPDAILVHEYLTVDGAKLSKSSGNAVDPGVLAERYGTDALRWWLLREVAALGDTDFTEARLVARYDRDLANDLGNLVNRTLSLVHRYTGGEVAVGRELVDLDAGLAASVDRSLSAFDFRGATDAIWAVVAASNRLVETERPWELARRDRHGDRLDAVLATLVGACRGITRELTPFLPEGCARLAAQLGGGRLVASPRPVFPRLG
jgi:methionyl-tRNA synthetase